VVVLVVVVLGATLYAVLLWQGRSPSTLVPVLGPGQYGLDALSPDLAQYVTAQGDDMGVAIYDATHDRTYTANADKTYILASSAKVYLMLADLDRIETQGRQPSDNDDQLLTAMIEHSDNDAAQAIYVQIGYDSGQQRFLRKIGITDYTACADGWGCAKASAGDMVHALTLLQKSQILNADDRTLALGLMRQVEADQRMGVGETAPSGATFYMKDGWLNYPDPSLWNLNSSGIIVADNVTYILSVYTQNQPGEDWTRVDHVCAAVANKLV
jgi:beta-lactamase class A